MRALLVTLLLQSATAFGYMLNGDDSRLRGWDATTLVVNEDFSQCPRELQANLPFYVARARAAWNAVPDLTIGLRRGVSVNVSPTDAMGRDGTGSPVILCDNQFPKNTSSDPNSIPALTGILVEQSTQRILYGYTMLNADPVSRVNVGQIDPDGLVVVIAHEFGHLLGLGHSADPRALMYYDVSGKTDVTPSSDDISGVQHLYSASNPKPNVQGGCGRTRDSDSAWFIQALAVLAIAKILLKYRSRARPPAPALASDRGVDTAR